MVQLIVRLRGLITLPILSRLIGAAGYGVLAPLTALSGIILSVILVGSNTSLNVFIPGRSPQQRRQEFWGIAQITLITSSVVFVLLLLFYNPIQQTLLTPDINSRLYLAGMLIIPVSAFQMVLYAQIVNNQQGKAYSKIIVMTSLVELLLLTTGAYWFGVLGVLIAMLIAKLVLCVSMVWVVQAQDHFVLLSPSYLPNLKKYYTYGFLMVSAGLMAWIVDSSDRFIIARYLGTEELGVYQVAYSLGAQIHQLAAPLFATLMPFVTGAINAGNREKAQYHLEQSYKILLLVFVPALVLLSLNSNDLLSVLTTPEFVRGAVIMPFVATGLALWQIAGVYTYNLHAHKRGHVLIISVGSAAIVNVGLNFLFVPKYGIIGAAVSTLIAYLTAFVLNWYFSRQSLKIGISKGFLLKLAIASFGMILFTLALQTMMANFAHAIRLVITISISGSVYLALVYFLRVFAHEEQARLWQAAKAAFLPSKGEQ